MGRLKSISVALLGLGLAGGLSSAALAGAEDAIGTWKDNERGGIIKLYSCGPGICVQVVKPAEAGAKDVNNPKQELRGRPLAGLVIMTGARKSGDNAWSGRLYNTEDGQVYTGAVTVVGKNEIQMQGCVLGGIICKSRGFTRMK